ncbi:MAG: AAA family ATPase [Deltaproteobacteria bacterium]|nr:MAG: AAA family ATPase [Deltaproteobacteria bacterium]
MKIHEVTSGVAATLRVTNPEGAFSPPPATGDELVLVSSSDQILARAGDLVWPVRGTTPLDHDALVRVVDGAGPFVAFVARCVDDTMVVETRRFRSEVRLGEPLDIGLDDKALDDLRRTTRRGGSVVDIVRWLSEQLLLPPIPGGPSELARFVVAGDLRDRPDVFRIYGRRLAVDVRRADGKLRVERAARGATPGREPLTLMLAPVRFVDATLTAELTTEARAALEQAVADAGSYLAMWEHFHALDVATTEQQARAFGAVEYTSRKQGPERGWTFRLVKDESLAERLAVLADGHGVTLEVGERAPSFDGTGRPRRKEEGQKVPFSSHVTHLDAGKGRLDLAPADDEAAAPPEKGFLFIARAGDRTRQARRERAEEALRNGTCPMPQLGLLMEGRPAPAARLPRRPAMSPAVRALFGPDGPTQRQREAIERALNTPDVCLIQGPPGTGKTKVITAIEARVAELADEGLEVSHRVLVTAAQHDAVENVAQRTDVFGLPAVKIGRRRGDDGDGEDAVDRFREDRIDALRAKLRVPPEAERLAKARAMAVACMRTRALPDAQARRVREIASTLDGLLPPALVDRALDRAASLESRSDAGDPEQRELELRAARGIRVTPGPFSDDGPLQAAKALRRLDDRLTPDERAYLERCAQVEQDVAPDWIDAGAPLRDALIDRLSSAATPTEARLDDDTQRLLLTLLDAVDHRYASAELGDGAAIAGFMRDLEGDPEGVREMLQHYTVVLAATLQQAAGRRMMAARGLTSGSAEFETVIVDEAARAHPLDLFIPLSMAKRRVVLVGDHRQLPHLLEPDVERQLADGVESGSVGQEVLEAVQASLFQRLWESLRHLEKQDGIKRTVTLDVQYRMHPVLGDFISRTFYEHHGDGRVESPRPAGDLAHQLPEYLRDGEGVPAAWLDVPAHTGAEVPGRSKRRPAEAKTMAREVRRLVDADPTLTFGVIAFYAGQVDEIGEAMLKEGLTERTHDGRGWEVAAGYRTTVDADGRRVERLRVGTVDAFQGREFDVVLLSVTRSNTLPGATPEQQRRKYGHLMLDNRLCVAMSRQKRLLIAVGDLSFVREAEPLRALRELARLCGGSHGVIR